MKERNVRDQMVVATKFTTCFPDPRNPPRVRVNYAGNSTKSLHLSLEASLKKLQTSYIDLLYVHWWDFTTRYDAVKLEPILNPSDVFHSIPELMQSLNTVVNAGKVLYLGVSDTPAWIVSKANQCKQLTFVLNH